MLGHAAVSTRSQPGGRLNVIERESFDVDTRIDPTQSLFHCAWREQRLCDVARERKR